MLLLLKLFNDFSSFFIDCCSMNFVSEDEVISSIDVQDRTVNTIWKQMHDVEIKFVYLGHYEFIRCDLMFVILWSMLSYALFHIHYCITHLDKNVVFVNFRFNLVRQIKVLCSEMLRDRKRNVHKRVESDGYFATFRAFKSRLELTLHDINNYWLIPLKMSVPELFGNNLIRSIIRFPHLDIRLLLNPV